MFLPRHLLQPFSSIQQINNKIVHNKTGILLHTFFEYSYLNFFLRLWRVVVGIVKPFEIGSNIIYYSTNHAFIEVCFCCSDQHYFHFVNAVMLLADY